MDTLLEFYSKICNELESMNSRLNSVYQELDNLEAKYAQDVSNAQANLQKRLEDNEHNTTRVNAFIGIAKTHSATHIDATEPHPFNSGVLSRISVQINSGLHDDPFAIQLYTEANAQLLYLVDERSSLTKVTENEIKNINQAYEFSTTNLKEKINTTVAKIKTYLSSDEFQSFIRFLQNDKNCFNASSDTVSLSPGLYGTISLGSVEREFPCSRGMNAEFVDATKGFANTSNLTISVPANISIKNGQVIIAEYENQSENFVLKGIQNFILNIAKYYGQDFSQVVFVDPIRFNSSSLGPLSALCGSVNSFIDAVPTSLDDVRKKLKNVISEINIREVRSEHLSLQSKKKALYLFHDFPQSYDANMVSQIQQLCVNAEHYGCTVVLTHNKSSKNYSSSDVYQFLQNIAVNIQTANGSFTMVHGEMRASKSFKWYQAPTVLPSDISRIYIEEKPVVNLSNDYSSRIGLGMPTYQKGVRRIDKIPFGINAQGEMQYLDFENSNFATFISGASRSGKSTLLHTLITGMIKNNHPDDIEIWLIDFKMTEFSRYINHTPPHVRYIILDESPELVYDILDRLTEILIKRQNMFKGKWLKLGEVPKEKYMPAIMVIIDEFSVMSQIIADSITSSNENYSVKLQMLLAKGAALGLHFIFASQGFTSGTRGLNDFSKKQIQQRIALKTEYNEIKETLDIKSASDEDKAMMEQLTVHHTLTRIPADERGNHLKLSQVLHISDYTEQEQLIDSVSSRVLPAPRYSDSDISAYIDKKTMVVDGNLYLSFYSKLKDMQDYLVANRERFEDDAETPIFVGEPRRMMQMFPLMITNEFCENILMIAPQNEKMAASSILLSLSSSLEIQNKTLKIWTTKKQPIYRQIHFDCGKSYETANDLSSVCEAIKKHKQAIQEQREGNEYIVLLGFESLFTDMSFQSDTQAQIPGSSGAIYEKRGASELDLLSQMAAELAITPVTQAEAHTNTTYHNSDGAYDAREDLKYILTNGPRLGYHFILVFGTVGDVKQTKIDASLFKHKLVFRTAKVDAMNIVNASNASVIEGLEDHSFRYTNGLVSLSFRPYLHSGLSWDGWQLSGNQVVNAVDEEEEYLL